MKSQCAELGLLSKHLKDLTQEDIKIADFVVDDIHHVILKPVQKTGCTSWRDLFLDNSPIQRGQLGTFDKPRYKEVGLEVLNETLLKVAFYKLEHYFTILTVRHPLKRLESFFAKNFLRHKLENSTIPSETRVMEFFREFSDILMAHKRWHYHWDSIYNRSFPCSVNYR